jgi:hypothetical protein
MVVPRAALLRLWRWRDCVKCVIAQRQLHSRSADRRIARAACETGAAWRRPLRPPPHRSLPAGVGARSRSPRDGPARTCRYVRSLTEGWLSGSLAHPPCRIFASLRGRPPLPYGAQISLICASLACRAIGVRAAFAHWAAFNPACHPYRIAVGSGARGVSLADQGPNPEQIAARKSPVPDRLMPKPGCWQAARAVFPVAAACRVRVGRACACHRMGVLPWDMPPPDIPGA